MGTTLIIATLLFGLSIIISNIMRKENEERLVNLELAPIGEYTMPNLQKTVDLSRYFVDQNGNLYSSNPKTWEINSRKGKDILVCSNTALDSAGNIVNSLRGLDGKKVTLRRRDINFNSLAIRNGSYKVVGKMVTPRHIKVLRA